MRITNRENLPWPVVAAVLRDPYCAGKSDVSVTTVIGPPQIRVLRERHQDEIEVDVTDRIWALLGSLGHAILERAGGSQSNQAAIVEQRLYEDVRGWVLGGQMDLVAPSPDDAGSLVLSDYKVTSVWTWIYGGRWEWEAQLNIYRHLCRKHGIEPISAQVVCIFRDWHRATAERDRSYPQVPIQTMTIPDWGSQTEKYISERIQLHQGAEALPDEDLPPCSPEERWEHGEVFAVKREGRKRAMAGGLHESEEAALDFIADQKDPDSLFIEHRPATPVRCLSYCEVSAFCHQWRNDPRNPDHKQEVN